MALLHRTLAPTAVAVVAAAALVFGGAAEPAAPGEAGYWVKLQALQPSEGIMEPAFDEDGTEFTLNVNNNHVGMLTLTFGLNMQKYDALHLPKIFINDEEFKYSPLDILEYKIPLDETPAPFDNVYRIKIADPAGAVGWPFPRENSHEYTLRVKQPPVFEKLVEAVGIRVYGLDGKPLEADKAFDPKTRVYHYRVTGMDSTVKVEANCTPWATGMRVDDVEVPLNETQAVKMKHAVKHVNVQCQYADPKYTSGVQQKTYALKLKRAVQLDNFNVALKISAEQGYCAMRSMGEGHGHDHVMGFVCRSAVSKPTFLAIYENPQVDVILVGHEDQYKHSLPNGMAVPIKLSGKRSNFTLKVLGSAEPWEFPVEVIEAASCSTLKCSNGQFHRKGILDIEAAQAHLCLEEVCTAKDKDRCCEDAPTCDTVEDGWCPHGLEPRRDGEQCAHDPCNDEDKATCCGHHHLRHRHHVSHPKDAMAKKQAYFKKVGCAPVPAAACSGQSCYFDDTCRDKPAPRLGGLGCWAAGIAEQCRFCGFGIYEKCPETYDCEKTEACDEWSPEHGMWCIRNYGVHCAKLPRHMEFRQNHSLAGAMRKDETVDASAGAPSFPLGAVLSFGLLSFAATGAAAVTWRVRSRRSTQAGVRRQMLLIDGETRPSVLE